MYVLHTFVLYLTDYNLLFPGFDQNVFIGIMYPMLGQMRVATL